MLFGYIQLQQPRNRNQGSYKTKLQYKYQNVVGKMKHDYNWVQPKDW